MTIIWGLLKNFHPRIGRLMICLLIPLYGCFFFRKDKEPEKVVEEMNGVVEQVIEVVDTLEERTKDVLESTWRSLSDSLSQEKLDSSDLNNH